MAFLCMYVTSCTDHMTVHAGHMTCMGHLLSQECDCHGNKVQERVEQAIDEMKERIATLEKRGRSEVGGEVVCHLCTRVQ